MSETILCPIDLSNCSCGCNCQAFFSDMRKIIVNSLFIDVNQYTFDYTISNPSPALSHIIFCVQCPVSTIEISSANTQIQVIGYFNGTPVPFTVCASTPCPPNTYSVEYNFGEDSDCCHFQGIKINVEPADDITEIQFKLIFTLPDELSFSFTPGVLKIKAGVEESVAYNLCVPGCLDKCETNKTTCELWNIEKQIVLSKTKVFIHFSQLLFPDSLDLELLTIEELENKIRQLSKLENTTAKLNCEVAKVLLNLNNLKNNECCCN